MFGQRRTVAIVDGHNLLWRAAFGFPARVRGLGGIDITPAFGFFALLRAGIRELGEEIGCIICFDGQHGPGSRKTLDSSYKDNRTAEPVPHMAFLEPIKRALSRFGILWYEYDIYEADDVIASIVASRLQPVAIMSTDKDFYQLVAKDICVLNSQRKQGCRIIRESHIREMFGVEPSQWCDFRALTGDPADCIAGVPGVGLKTAARLLRGGLTLESLTSENRLSGNKGKQIAAMRETLLRNRELIRLNDQLPISVRIEAGSVVLPKAPDAMRSVGLL